MLIPMQILGVFQLIHNPSLHTYCIIFPADIYSVIRDLMHRTHQKTLFFMVLRQLSCNICNIWDLEHLAGTLCGLLWVMTDFQTLFQNLMKMSLVLNSHIWNILQWTKVWSDLFTYIMLILEYYFCCDIMDLNSEGSKQVSL